jgi:hypothetical protein
MNTSQHLSILTMMVVLGAPLAAQAQTVGGAALGAVPDKRGQTFKRTQSGDFETTVVRPDGSEFVYTFVPSTKIAPAVRVKLAQTPGEARFVYQYEFANAQTAQQEFAVLYFDVVNPIIVKQMPAGWVNEARPSGGSVSWRGPLIGAAPAGVAPGQTLSGAVIESPALPGISRARARGNTVGSVEVPPGLSSQQYAELQRISKQATVELPIIAPLIGAGAAEPELRLGVLLARIGGNYVAGFHKYQHPQAAALDQAFQAIYGAEESLDDPAMKKGLASALAIAQVPVQNAWHQQMSDALALCMRAVSTGTVPNRRLLTPQDFDR